MSLQIKVNKLVRQLDSELPCISCGRTEWGDAGHYMSIGSTPQMRYNLWNIHGQCRECNNNFSKANYEQGLISRYGEGICDKIQEYRYFSKKMLKFELEEMERRVEDISGLFYAQRVGDHILRDELNNYIYNVI